MNKSKVQHFADPSPDYWKEYSNLQKVKHDLIAEYLKGWFPKLGFWAGKILYVDTHAGRGKHARGQSGSPLVALKTVLEHSSRDSILRKSEMIFHFIERDEENLECLKQEIAAYQSPPKIKVHPHLGNCFDILSPVLSSLRQAAKGMAPAFFFIDPYGFKVPGELLRDLMSFPRVELFVNVIWRELDMAMQGNLTPGMRATLDSIFTDGSWEQRITSDDFDERANQAIDLLKEKTGAKWGTPFFMRGDNNATRYYLLHLTNHDEGRNLMKDCLWKICPDGGFYARKSDNSAQPYLIERTPDLRPLREWVMKALSTRPRRWSELTEELLPEIWRPAHLNSVISELRNEQIIEPSQYTGRFGPTADPFLSIVKGQLSLI